MFRQIKHILKLLRCQESKPLVRTLVLVLENPLVDYLLHLGGAHRLVVVVEALRLQRAYEPLDERLVLRSVRPAPVLRYLHAIGGEPPLRLATTQRQLALCIRPV